MGFCHYCLHCGLISTGIVFVLIGVSLLAFIPKAIKLAVQNVGPEIWLSKNSNEFNSIGGLSGLRFRRRVQCCYQEVYTATVQSHYGGVDIFSAKCTKCDRRNREAKIGWEGTIHLYVRAIFTLFIHFYLI